MKGLLIVGLIFGANAFAQGISGIPTNPDVVSCTVRIFADDILGGFKEVKVDAPVSSGTHGGNGHVLNVEKHEITLQIDGKWRSIYWKREGKSVATTVTLSGSVLTAPHVVIAFNPANDQEQVALTCD